MPACHSQFYCHTQLDRPDGENDMLGYGSPDEVEQLHIALANRNTLIGRLSYQVEDAQLTANGLREWVHRLSIENTRLRQQLGLRSLNPPHLPPRYPDSALAKALSSPGRTDHTQGDYFTPPPKPPTDLTESLPKIG